MTRIETKQLISENFSNKTDSEGKKVSKSLSNIISVVKEVNVNHLKGREIQKVITNVQWAERKIQKYNQKIDKNFALRIVDNLLNYLFSGKFQLKYETLSKDLEKIEDYYTHELKEGEQLLSDYANYHNLTEEKLNKMIDFLRDFELPQKSIPLFSKIWAQLPQAIKEQPSIVEKFFKYLPVDSRTQFLLETEEKTLGIYYKDRSFSKDYQLDQSLESSHKINFEEELTPEIVQLLTKLIKIQNKTTLLEIQNTPILRHLVIKELTAHLESITVEPEREHTLDALKALDRLSTFIPQENLLQILIFVRENREAIFNEVMGVESKSRANIRKMKREVHHIPYDLIYHVDNGSLEVKAGELGKGQYKVAYKQLSLTSPELEKQVMAKQEKSPKEIELLTLAKGCKHVIQFHSVDDYRSHKKRVDRQAMVFPLYSLGELGEFLKKNSLSEKAKLRIAIDIIEGVLELHALGILHRDIKPANIFLERVIDKNGKEEIRAFVGDLGLGCMRANDADRKKAAGTPYYQAPELFAREMGDFDTDAWAVGVTLSELYKGVANSPLHKAKTLDQLLKIQHELGDRFKNPPPSDQTSVAFVIWGLLERDRATRMPLKQALVVLEEKLASLS